MQSRDLGQSLQGYLVFIIEINFVNYATLFSASSPKWHVRDVIENPENVLL